MSTTTGNLGLFKYNTTEDAFLPFSIDNALNANWDIIDDIIGNLDPLPSQSGNAGKLLTTNGTNASWGATQEIFPCVSKGSNTYGEYRRYSDGWIEQYGYVNRTATKGITVTLPLSFTSAFYTVIATYEAKPEYATAVADSPYIVDKTSTQITIFGNGAIANWPYFFWYVCGY